MITLEESFYEMYVVKLVCRFYFMSMMFVYIVPGSLS